MRDNPDAAVWLGRVLGLIVVVIVIAVGLKFTSFASQGESFDGWLFFSMIVTPLGIGFLIIMSAEVINQLRQR